MEQNHEILVSVLIAAYNAQNFIERCLNSLVHQTLKNIEIILIDDGSSDNTGKICDRCADTDHRVHVIHQKNAGPSMARQAGLNAARGKYISFVDSDDWCEADMCETLFQAAAESEADLVFCSAYRHRSDGIAVICNLPLPEGIYAVKDVYNSYILPLYGDLKKDPLITTGYVWCCLFKKEILQNIMFFKEISLHEDEIMLLQALSNAKTIFITDSVLYHYNRMEENTLSKRNAYWDGYWENITAVFQAKRRIGERLFRSESEYMHRLVTWLYLKFFRSVRNETHYTNPKGFWGGLRALYQLKHTEYLTKYKSYLLYTELAPDERLLARFIRRRLYFTAYFYYTVKYSRMRSFREKTKN